jgi:hypothetical protein
MMKTLMRMMLTFGTCFALGVSGSIAVHASLQTSPAEQQWLTWYYHHGNGTRVTLSATFGLQGRAPQPSVPLRVRLMRGNRVIQRQVVNTTNGGFSLGNIAPGRYTLWVKHAQYLATRIDVTVGTSGASVAIGDLRSGDVNNDNRITLRDFNILARSFNRMPGQRRYDARADLNGDGEVSLLDFSLLALNFNS